MTTRSGENNVLRQALAYARLGMKVIPVHSARAGVCGCSSESCQSPGKHPRTARGIKDGSAQSQTLRQWFGAGESNLGVVTGKDSGVVVLDIDPRNGGDASLRRLIALHGALPATLRCQTGGGGEHYYFRYPEKGLRSGVFDKGIDLKADGGFVVAPPSVHASGEEYAFPPGWEKSPIALCPAWLLERTAPAARSPQRDSAEMVVIPAGERNKRLTSMGGSMRNAGLSETEIAAALHAANSERCESPLPDDEVNRIAQSVARYPAKADQQEVASQAAKLVEVGLQHEQFVDEMERGYAVIPVDGHLEYVPLTSKRYREILSITLWDKDKKVPGAEAVANAVNILTGLARDKGRTHTLSNRFAGVGGDVYYDLADKEYRVVRINSKGWVVVNSPKPIFRRYGHQLPQVDPARGGHFREFLQYVNVSDPDEQLLLLVWLVFAFIPDLPHPIMFAHGEQGSAKSTFFKMIRRLLDPSRTEVLAFHGDKGELIQQLSHQAVAMYDNVSSLKLEISDALCRAVTGEGFTKRALYTDDEDVIMAYRRIIGLNGVNVAASMPDLLDRSLIFELSPIRGARWTEEELWKKFEAVRPRLLGAIFDTLSRAMALKSSVKLQPRFRMADFAVMGCAIARALGSSEEAFVTALRRNADRHNEVALESSPLALVLLEFMEKKKRFEATPTALHRLLGEMRGTMAVPSSRGWPQTPSALTRQLNVIKPVLRRLGIEVTTARDSSRLIILERVRIADDADASGGAVRSAGTVGSVGKSAASKADEVIDETEEVVEEE